MFAAHPCKTSGFAAPLGQVKLFLPVCGCWSSEPRHALRVGSWNGSTGEGRQIKLGSAVWLVWLSSGSSGNSRRDCASSHREEKYSGISCHLGGPVGQRWKIAVKIWKKNWPCRRQTRPVSGTFPGSQDPFQRSRALWDCAQTPLFPLVNACHTRLRLRCGITSILHARHPGLRRRSNFETRRQRVIKKRDAKLADPLTRQDDE